MLMNHVLSSSFKSRVILKVVVIIIGFIPAKVQYYVIN